MPSALTAVLHGDVFGWPAKIHLSLFGLRQQAAAVPVEIVDNENGLSAAADCQCLIPQEGSEFGGLLQLNTDDGNFPAIKPQSGKH